MNRQGFHLFDGFYHAGQACFATEFVGGALTPFDAVKRRAGDEVDLACAAFGGRIVSASNEHYSPATNVISPFPPLDMMDGLESARSRTVGHSENVVIALGRAAKIARIELDFSHFVNNNPRDVSIDGLMQGIWTPLVARTSVKAFGGNSAVFAVDAVGICDQVRVTIFPDGGMNRVRVWCDDRC